MSVRKFKKSRTAQEIASWIKEISSYTSGKIGLALLIFFIAISIYALVTLPPNFRYIWNNPRCWHDYPELAPPAWVRLLGYQKAAHKVTVFDTPSRIKTYGPYRVFIYSTYYDLDVKDYPQDLIFRYPGEYAFGMEVSSQGNSSVYIDDFNCILYGNAFGLLGTDNAPDYPRDLFSALVYGSRVSLIVGILSAIFSTLIGLVAGLVSGYVGGFVDEIIMRVADLLLVLPGLPLFIVLASVMKSTYGLVSIWNIIIILSLLGWMGFARTVRSMVLSIRERAFIEAARAAGASTSYIIFRHVVPNVFALVYITLATAVPGAIITEASLSWLGLGDPMVPSWGKTLYDFNTSGIAVSKGLSDYWFWVFPPCIAIMLLSISFILIGFALDEILNPRLRLRR